MKHIPPILNKLARLFWIPFLAMGVSNMLGGLISDALYSKTNNLNLARKIIMGIAALLMFPVLFVKLAPSPGISYPDNVYRILCPRTLDHKLYHFHS